MTIEEYKNTFDIPSKWFVEEVSKGYHAQRLANVHANKDYLRGVHKVLGREDSTYKGKTYKTKKLILQYAKSILKFHATYLLGNPVSLTGDEEIKKTYNDIYKYGLFSTTDYQVLTNVLKFGDAYEVDYYDNGKIKAKVLDNADCYPVYNDLGEYISFIEHWTDIYSNISYWNVYYNNYVEHWDNEGGEENLSKTDINVCGLPIHFHSFNDDDSNFGLSFLDDLKPLLDELEDVLSKMGDGIYTLSLNPLPVITGQRLDGSSVSADATGYALNLDDNATFDYKNAQMDYNTIKLYLDSVKEMLNQVGSMPSILGNSNVANVSEVSLKMLYHLANVNADDIKKWLNIGMNERFEKFKKILKLQGINVLGNVGIEYNLNMPVATNEVVENLKTMKDMGAISTETIMEKSGLITDVSAEMTRVSKDNSVPNKDDESVIVGIEQ
jgi:SPP1 family phage portal protein